MNPIKLTDFARMLEAGIRDQFGQSSYWVTGELSNLKIYENKGHLYFHLVEKDASTGVVSAELSCVGFNAAYASVRAFEEATGQAFSNGIEVLVQVIVAFHPVKGLKVQLQHVDVNYSAGKIQQQRKLSIKKLVDENPDAAQIIDGQLFTRNQSHQLPLAFRKLAVISSEQSAGFQDFMHTLEQNAFGYKIDVDLYPTVVQGEANVSQLVNRMVEIFTSNIAYDALILVRGGGSQTDFLLYDAYPLIKAVSRFPIPVITGLGHLKDISLTDMVAHTSLKTPTMVAEFIIARNRSFEDHLFSVRQQIVIVGQKLLHAAKGQLVATRDEIRSASRELCVSERNFLVHLKNSLCNDAKKLIRHAENDQLDLKRRVTTLPAFQLQRSGNELNNHLRGIQSTAMQFQKSKLTELHAIENIIRILGPESTMKRGYALVLKKGKVVRDIQQISINDTVEIQLIGGQASATINTTNKNG